MSLMLGQGESSPLMHKLRNESGLALYSVAHSFLAKDPGLFIIQAAVAPKNILTVIDKTGEVIEEFCRGGLTEEALIKAKTIIQSSDFYSLETVEGLAKKTRAIILSLQKHKILSRLLE